MLTCQELTELVTDYVEGRMPLLRRAEFQFHLGICKHCRAYLKQMRATVHSLPHLPVEIMPPDVKAELLKRFASMKPPTRNP